MAYADNYTKRPVSAAQYVKMRGVTDFTNAAQFNLFESGYSFLFIVSVPPYLQKLCDENISGKNSYIKNLCDAFYNILEYEFKGLDGIDDITTETLTYTDGISEMNGIGKVIKQSAAEVTMSFTEKSGSTITKFIEMYLTGIKDPRSQAKTYHGLIERGALYPGFEQEVFTLFYIVTDNTMLQIEKAYLLLNAWPTSARTGSLYNSEKGTIEKKDIDVTFQCFLLDGDEVNKRALQLLTNVMGKVTKSSQGQNTAVASVLKAANNGMDTAAAIANANDVVDADRDKVQRSYIDYNYDILRPNSDRSLKKNAKVGNIDVEGYVKGDGTR